MQDYLDQLLKYLNIWDTRKGLLFLIILWTFFALYLLPKFVIFISENFIELHLNFYFFVIVLFSGYLFYYLYWAYRRSFSFLSNKINVIFAIFNVGESDDINSALINLEYSLKEKIADLNLANQILIHFKPSDISIESKEKAEELVQKGYVGSTLIVWGKAYKFQNEIRCSSLNFTYFFAFKRYYKNLPDEFYKKILNKPIQNSIDSLKWNLPLNISFSFEKYVVNISEIVMFILGLTLTTIKRYKDAIVILEGLYDSFRKFNLLEQKKRSRLIVGTQEQLIKLYNFFLFNYYLENNLQGMEDYSLKALAIDNYNYAANLSAAICEEEKEDRENAKKFTRRAELSAVKNANTHRFNLAYFALDEGNFQEAINQYNFLMKHNVQLEPVIVADYLCKKYIKTKKIEFSFGEALVKIHWLNEPHDGKKIMRNFLKKTCQNNQLKKKYSILIKKGKEML